MKSLLSFQYGYDVGEVGDESQVLSRSMPDAGNQIINVAHLGSLLIGSGELVPLSPWFDITPRN